jgi:cell wall-associated NlpC family hydrolase
VYHVGIYIGGGQMIDAPETGQDVSISSIYWSNLLGAGRI